MAQLLGGSATITIGSGSGPSTTIIDGPPGTVVRIDAKNLVVPNGQKLLVGPNVQLNLNVDQLSVPSGGCMVFNPPTATSFNYPAPVLTPPAFSPETLTRPALEQSASKAQWGTTSTWISSPSGCGGC